MTAIAKDAETYMKRQTARRSGMRIALSLPAVSCLLALAGCDVVNPGPVQDEFLALPTAHQALVNGAGARLVQGLSAIASHGAYAARELFPTGNCCGIPNQSLTAQAGHFDVDNAGTYWGNPHQARWIAEDAVRRFTALGAGKVDAAIFAQAYIWAGYANRLLGETMCEAVFDGGPKEPNIKYFERAQTAFTNAINMGTGNVKTAGYAGRASVRVWLKDWAGAVSDAQQVPFSFEYRLVTDPTDRGTLNGVWYNSANSPYRSYSSFATRFLDYYNQTGDPRVRIGTDPTIKGSSGTLPGYGVVPWSFQLKYPKPDAPFRLSTGREMVLIRAEAALVAGDWAGAMPLINSLRADQISQKTGTPLTPWSATNVTEAWTFLKRERSIELWLEARRMGDLRRWAAAGTPGAIDWPDFEAYSTLFKENPVSNCIPIPQEEINTNPNF